MTYDLIVVGTGFASSFFLLEYLARAGASARVLVLERGWREPRDWQLRHRRASRLRDADTFRRAGAADKEWAFTLAFGGGSNCWWGCAPRLLPNDYRMRTTYGVGDDWPMSYADLEPFVERAEDVMAIAGDVNGLPYPRRTPHPQPPHRMSEPDRLLAQSYPSLYAAQPTARARVPTARRAACCANGVCGLCPIDAKFTIENGLPEVYADPRVTLRTGAEATRVETAAGRADGVAVVVDGRDEVCRGDLLVLGTGAIFNAAILLRSGLPHPLLGRRLFEQVSVTAWVELDGVDNFQGSTAITGQGYMLYDTPARRERAACLLESWNRPDQLRWEAGRERQLLSLKCIFEDLPQERNRVVIGQDEVPVLEYYGHSEYTRLGIEALPAALERVLAPLPVERLLLEPDPAATESHILGTVVMGDDPARSVVDRALVHHQVRNLVVLGGSAFPTGSPTHPTLTISALALWSAHHLLR